MYFSDLNSFSQSVNNLLIWRVRNKVDVQVVDRAAFGALEDFINCAGEETVVELEVSILVFHFDGLVC